MQPSSAAPSPLDARLLATLERAFAGRAGGDGRLGIAELKAALGLHTEYVARRMMQIFDANGDGVVTKDEFLAAVRALVFGSDRQKLFFAFRLYDHDGDGFLDRLEIERMISLSLAESSIAERATQTSEHLAHRILASADRDHDGRISFDEFAKHVESRPELLRQMTRSEAIWLAPNEELLVLLDERARAGRMPAPVRYGREGLAPGIVLGVFFAANVALFIVSWLRTGGPPPMEPFARAGRAFARCADLDGALILVPMMRRLITRVRATWLGRILPVDDAIDFHRITGHTLFAAAWAHAACFTTAYGIGHAKSPVFHILALGRGLTGASLLLVFTVMWVFALRFVRRTNKFELFYFTHLLYVAWLVLAVVHAPVFAIWAGVPIAGFLVEQILRLSVRAPSCAVRSSQPLRSGVTRLEIERPPAFTFRPGDYSFLCVPAVAKHEWHPFTISSAPERDRLVFHVRSLGNWTGALRRYVEARPDDPALLAYVDGPYGSPSGHIFDARFAVLIGAGIGVTPFASVLESLVFRIGSGATMKLERAHFFWLSNDQYSFEWFAALLSEFERRDTRGMLDIHLMLTGARTGVSAMGLEIARDIMRSAKRSDIITGLRAHTHVGPPDWDAALSFIAKQHAPEPVHVFFCGPPGLEAKLRPICGRLGLAFRAERF